MEPEGEHLFNIRQYHIIVSTDFGGPFPPQICWEKPSIHKVFRRFHIKSVTQDTASNLQTE